MYALYQFKAHDQPSTEPATVPTFALSCMACINHSSQSKH
jgi:hypothetical protein